MRLDLFLKRTCLLKHRSEAKRACENGIVTIDGQPGKAGRNVAPGQRVSIAFVDRYLEVEILSLPLKNVSRSDAKSLYQVIRDETRDAVDF